MTKLPKNPYDRNLTSAETFVLLKKNWEILYVQPCGKCRGRGCERCNNVGILGTICDPRSSKHYFGNPPLEPQYVGAACSFYTANSKMYIKAVGGGGEAEIVLYPTQLFDLMRYVVLAVTNGLQYSRDTEALEFGVEAKFTGPPVMYLAALKKKRMTCTHRPTAKQAKAIKLLKDAGFDNEAGLLASALEHEVFRGDAKESEKCRKAVGKIEPGTIFKRVGKNVVFTEEKK